MTKHNRGEPTNLDALRADDDLIEDLRRGAEPPDDDQIAKALAAMRDQARGGKR